MVDFTTGIGYCSTYSWNLLQSVSSTHSTIEKTVMTGLPNSEWLSLVAVGHACKRNCFMVSPRNWLWKYISGFKFSQLEMSKQLPFHLLTHYEVISLTLIFIAGRGGPVVTDRVVWIYSIWERNILADVQYCVTNSCRRGSKTPAPHHGEIGARCWHGTLLGQVKYW